MKQRQKEKSKGQKVKRSTCARLGRSSRAIAVVAIVVFSALAVAGCYQTDDSPNGTYVHLIRTPGDGIGSITLKLSGYDTAVFTVQPPGEKPLPSTEGTYKVKDDTIIVTINNGVSVFKRRGGILEGEFLDEMLTLKRK